MGLRVVEFESLEEVVKFLEKKKINIKERIEKCGYSKEDGFYYEYKEGRQDK